VQNSSNIAISDCELSHIWIYNQQNISESIDIIDKREDVIARNDGTLALMKIKKQVIDTGINARTEYSFPVSDKILTYEIAATPFKNAMRQLIGVSTVAVEITYLKNEKSNDI
jgi:hypothetical protein